MTTEESEGGDVKFCDIDGCNQDATHEWHCPCCGKNVPYCCEHFDELLIEANAEHPLCEACKELDP